MTRMAALSAGVTTNTLSRRRELTARAAITAAGQTFIHIATVSNAVANRGRLPAHNSPRIATGTVTVSIRPSATGPSRARKRIHHHAAIRRRRDSDPDPNRIEKTMPFSRVTSTSQVAPYRTGPNNSATVIGAKARIGYTQGVSIPIRESPVRSDAVQQGDEHKPSCTVQNGTEQQRDRHRGKGKNRVHPGRIDSHSREPGLRLQRPTAINIRDIAQWVARSSKTERCEQQVDDRKAAPQSLS